MMSLFGSRLSWRVLVAVLVWTLGCGGVHHAQAQDARETNERVSAADTVARAADIVLSRTRQQHVTLSGWAADRRLQMMARRHAFGDRTYDRGVFRHITPLMDDEYVLDMSNYRFSPLEDYTWQRLPSGIRVSTGSIVRAEWGILTEMKHTADIGDGHALRIDAVMQQDGQADRSFIEFNYERAFTPKHRAGIRHSFSNYKPDFDISLFYEYGTPWKGRVRTEVTMLDAYNNLIFSTLQTAEKDEPYVRIYDRIPVLGQFSLHTPQRYPVRAEVHAGWQPESELAVEAQANPADRYRDQEAAHYIGALVEYSRGPVTTGLMVQRDWATLAREGLGADVTANYVTEQRLQRGGVFMIGTWRSFRGEAWVFLEDYYDRNTGDDFSLATIERSMNYTEDRTNYRMRIAYVPAQTGWYTSLEYLGVRRTLSRRSWIMGNQWSNHWYSLGPSDYRMAGVAGYRFGSGAVAFGVNFDLDGDHNVNAGPDYNKKRFDNAYLRFALSW